MKYFKLPASAEVQYKVELARKILLLYSKPKDLQLHMPCSRGVADGIEKTIQPILKGEKMLQNCFSKPTGYTLARKIHYACRNLFHGDVLLNQYVINNNDLIGFGRKKVHYDQHAGFADCIIMLLAIATPENAARFGLLYNPPE